MWPTGFLPKYMADILYKLDECIICSSKTFFKTTFKQCDKSIHQKKKNTALAKLLKLTIF